MNVFEAIRGRFADLLWNGHFYDSVNRIQSGDSPAAFHYHNLIPGDFPGTWCWADIHYADQTRSDWETAKHYGRILITLREHGPHRLLEDPEYAEKMTGALEYWLRHQFKNPNWWHNDIGTPRNIADILLMLHPVLSHNTLIRGIELVSQGSMATRSDISEEWTGANLIWGAANTLKHAILIEDESLLRRAVAQASKELQTGTEGIQPDGSFFQHGPRLYSGGYGRSFAYDIAQLAYALQGTQYQFSRSQLDTFLHHILDGLRHMSQGNSLDYACIGREFSRINAVHAGILKSAVEIMTHTADIPRQEELHAYLDAMNGGPQLHATKYFPCAAMLCHHITGLYIGAKFATDQTWDAESCNGEGELCYNMSYGSHLCIMTDGSEYRNIAPLWDYARIPGTTAHPETDEQLLAHRDWGCSPLPNSHWGGSQKGNRAVIYELAQHDGVEVFVTHFAFESGFVCLGAGIHVDTVPLVTTVDQCHLQGNIEQRGNSILHHGIRYTGLDGTSIQWEAKTITGSWHRNSFASPDTPITGDIFTLYISQESDHYAFLISPASFSAPAVEVLRNDAELQAIRLPDGKIMAVFHQNTDLNTDGRTIHGVLDIYIEE